MTREAVHYLVGRGVVSDEFRRKLIGGGMTREQIAAEVARLDEKDIDAIRLAIFLNPGNFPSICSEINLYINRRYGPGAAPAGDDLPISV